MATQLEYDPEHPLRHMLRNPPQNISVDSNPWVALIGGGGLLLLGLSRRSLTGLIAAAVGGGLAYRAFQQLRPALQSSNLSPKRPPSPSIPTGLEDEVDEASWESFPASDPPGNY